LALVGSVSHAGLGTLAVSDAGARRLRRSSSEKKKNSFSFDGSTGPPTVKPKLLYFSSGGLSRISGSVASFRKYELLFILSLRKNS
jgi:hypothetical protein